MNKRGDHESIENGGVAMEKQVANIKPLKEADRFRWNELWKGYQEFYKADIPAEVSDLTWHRLHDDTEPMFALGCFVDSNLVGIVHYIFHRSCWTAGDYCYLQDLFTDSDFRGRGVARALIEEVYKVAIAAGASRVYWLTQETNEVARKLYEKVADRSGFIQYRKLF